MDLKIQHEFGCRGLTYWFDSKRNTAFCLIEAPDEGSIKSMHNSAHGQVPYWVIEVDAKIVESFLGRIEDPAKSRNTELNIINDPAFRTLMAVTYNRLYLQEESRRDLNSLTGNIQRLLSESVIEFRGTVVSNKDDSFLISFDSVSNAVLCAVKIHSVLKEEFHNKGNNGKSLKIGLSAGVPVTEKKTFFEDTIKSAGRMCFIEKASIVMTSEIMDLYKSENMNHLPEGDQLYVMTSSDEKYLHLLMDFIEKYWSDTELKVDDFSKPLGLSKSNLYRKMIFLFGKSPNAFLKEYRLTRALKLLTRKESNISEISYLTGFSSPSYFSKCFLKRYNVLPSDYQQIVK